jgi:hypothetical protein
VKLLTDEEKKAVRMAGELATLIETHVILYGSSRAQDVAELEFYVHGIQRMIMAQAAARTYPVLYRMLGTTTGGTAHASRDDSQEG